MNKTCIKGFLVVLVVCLSALLSIEAGECDAPATYLFTDQELDGLLAPIALYPDPLLAEILPASTYPDEVADAAAWVKSGGNPVGIDNQNWDEAVKAVAHYPSILMMMSEDMDWTADVGDAFLNQPEDVTNSIQRLRWQARAVGNLVSNSEQTVVVEDDYIQIIPAQPQYIYVPQYDPAVVYVQRPAIGIAPFITFGFGLAIGGWLSMDFDWHHHHVIYHGWNRHGWVNNARPYVHITNVYINRSRPYINQTWRHDASHGGPDRYWASRPSGHYAGRYAHPPDARGRVTPPKPPGGAFGYKRDAQVFSNRGRESLGSIQSQRKTPTPAVSQTPTRVAPGVRQPAGPPTPSASQRQATPPPTVSQAPARPAPGISQQQAPPTPSTRQRQATPPPTVSQAPARPAPGVSQQQAPPTPSTPQRQATPPPTVSQAPARPASGVSRPAAPTPSSSSGPSQPSSVRGGGQPAKTSSNALGGYRGANEARTLSLRGQASRQSSVGPPPAPARASAPANRGSAPAGKTPKGK